ncbi:MAG: transglutaminase TgpA family protein [Ktedonobacteraceae bacterium]
MQDAAVDRLSKLITDADARKSGGGSGQTGNNKNARYRKPLHLHLGLDEGWFSLFLLAAVVYSTIWCVQASDWVDHLGILSLTTALGLIIGVIAAKQQRFPRLYIHLAATLFGLLLAFWQTAGAFYDGNLAAFAQGIQQWIVASFSGAVGNNNSIFLFFITALGFVLAYTSSWLVYRTRNPWLMILANAVVLLINLNNIDAGYVVFLVVFLMASLLLLLRFNLYESVQRWQSQGLRYGEDLTWDIMQAGALISIGILILSWLLPWGYTNATASLIWSDNQNPWVQIQNTWNRIIAVNNSANPANHGNFESTLSLGGNPNLNNDIVFKVQSADPTQYLETLSYDNYDGRTWSDSPTYDIALDANSETVNESSVVRLDKQVVNVINPPGEDAAYILGAPQIASVNQPSQILTSKATSSEVALIGKNGKLAAGEHYTVYSYVSSADITSLESIPFPANSPKLSGTYDGTLPITYYDPSIVQNYTQVPSGLNPQILAKARSVTASASSMYDKAVLLESYFHTFHYDLNVSLPPGAEGVSWFLFDSGQRGYCNYFATAMTIMARLLGMPARVVAGYTNGQYDNVHHQNIIRGNDAHLWTQIYFAGYGWINFEPSAGFTPFSRPLTSQNNTGIGSSLPGSTGGPRVTTGKQRNENPNGLTNTGGSSTSSTGQALPLPQQAGLALGALVLLILFGLILFSIWWRRLFSNYRLSMQIYGRICMLAAWAGISLERSQTPYEYIGSVAEVTPQDATALQRFGDIYVRDLWADPGSADHPRRNGEVNELPSLWKKIQPHLFWYVIRHPRFLRYIPARFMGVLRQTRARRRAKRAFDEDL